MATLTFWSNALLIVQVSDFFWTFLKIQKLSNACYAPQNDAHLFSELVLFNLNITSEGSSFVSCNLLCM